MAELITNNFLNILNTSSPENVISIFGAGGKSSLIKILEQELFEKKIAKIISFTTKIGKEQFSNLNHFQIFTLNDIEKIIENTNLRTQRILISAPTSNTNIGKLTAVPAYYFKELSIKYPNIKFILEVDGAKKYPFKIHNNYEPVWVSKVKENEKRIAVLGLKALELPFKKSIHRLELIKNYTFTTNILTPKILADLIIKYWNKFEIDFLFLNQADSANRFFLGKELKNYLEKYVNYKIILSSLLN